MINFVFKTRDFVLKTRKFVLKMMNFAGGDGDSRSSGIRILYYKMMNFAFKMMNSDLK